MFICIKWGGYNGVVILIMGRVCNKGLKRYCEKYVYSRNKKTEDLTIYFYIREITRVPYKMHQ